jgi:pimeloyl-ACP methyl ester carboxylesterase
MRTEPVTFFSAGCRLRGILHLPGMTSEQRVPVLVHGPGWLEASCSSITEPFHQAFADAGYAVLHFQSRGTGESEGEPGWIRPFEQIEDLSSAITYAETRPELDSRRLGLFGLGGTGAGNAIYAAAFDHRVRCVIAQNVVADGVDWLRRMRREYEWKEFVARVRANQRRRVLENIDELVDPAEELMVATPERKAAGMPTPGRVFHLGSAESLLRYRPVDIVHLISPRALLMTCIVDDAVTPEHHARELYRCAGPPKRLIRQAPVKVYEAYHQNFGLLMSNFLDWCDRFLAAPAAAHVEEDLGVIRETGETTTVSEAGMPR